MYFITFVGFQMFSTKYRMKSPKSFPMVFSPWFLPVDKNSKCLSTNYCYSIREVKIIEVGKNITFLINISA